MTNRGVTYVAWREGIKEAERSAQSAKKFNLNTCLIAPTYNGNGFDRFIRAQERLGYPARKVFVYHLSPWDETLYLDSDTLVVGDLTFGFDMARKYGIALAIAPACFVKYHWGLNEEDLPADVPDYNGGVIFFNRHHPIMENFWQILQEELRKIDWPNQKRNPTYNDQSVLSILLYRKGINPYVLPQNWNFRPHLGARRGYGPIKIWHSRSAIPKDFDTRQKRWWTLKGKKDSLRYIRHEKDDEENERKPSQ